tara:strand:- start:2022 stop:3821 length:1800 start_codon:yes stop_codon:yes gene_type:complete
MSNIRIDIASEFKDKGFKAAEKRTTSLNRKFDNLARTAKRTFITIAGIQALKRSVVAFAEEDRAANKLEASLRNLGLAYNTQAIEDYLEQSEKATAISKDELSPAIAGLLSTTLDAEKSMRLLNLAMDISASTGKDLTSITTALSRAYNGNYASLGKLQTAFTSAELEAMGFEASVSALNTQFAGAAKNNADTYAGKIDKMKIAFGDLAEEIGAGIVAFLESLGDGDYDKGLQKLVDFGTAIGNVFRRAGLTIEYTKALLATGFRIDAGEQFKLDELRAQLANPQMGQFGVNRGVVRDYAKQLELQKKIVKERDKAVKLSEKDKKNQTALARAKAVFDLEKIQIEAALQGKITEEERTRLLLMKAILAEDADTATKLAEKLEKIQKQTVELAESLTNLKAGNPFSEWDKYFEDAKKNLKDLYDSLAKQQLALNALTSGIAADRAKANQNVLNAKTDRTTAYAEAAARTREESERAIREAAEAAAQAAKALLEAKNEEERRAALEGIRAAEAAAAAARLLEETIAVADFATALAAESEANEFLNQSMDAAFYAGIIPNVEINVNVEGNVTTAEDLAEVITDIQYNYQRTGKGLLLSSRAI